MNFNWILACGQLLFDFFCSSFSFSWCEFGSWKLLRPKCHCEVIYSFANSSLIFQLLLILVKIPKGQIGLGHSSKFSFVMDSQMSFYSREPLFLLLASFISSLVYLLECVLWRQIELMWFYRQVLINLSTFVVLRFDEIRPSPNYCKIDQTDMKTSNNWSSVTKLLDLQLITIFGLKSLTHEMKLFHGFLVILNSRFHLFIIFSQFERELKIIISI